MCKANLKSVKTYSQIFYILTNTPPQVNPAPIALIATKFPFLILPDSIDSDKANGIEAAEVLP